MNDYEIDYFDECAICEDAEAIEATVNDWLEEE